MGEPIAFLALARVRDQAVLASCFDKSALNEEKSGYEKALASMLELRAPTVYPSWKDSSACEGCDGKLYAVTDSQALTIAVAGVRDTGNYPDRVAHQLLQEFLDKAKSSQGGDLLDEARAGSLSKPLRNTMRELMTNYQNAGSHDKTTEVREKVDNLKGIMQDNVKRILETHATLDQVKDNSQSMSNQANQFLKQSVDLRRQVQIRQFKVKAIMAICVLSLLAYFALPLIPT